MTPKLALHSSLKVTKSYKQNGIFGYLHRGKRISTNRLVEVSFIDKFRKADYPLRFLNNVFIGFINLASNFKALYITTLSLFEEQNLFHFN